MTISDKDFLNNCNWEIYKNRNSIQDAIDNSFIYREKLVQALNDDPSLYLIFSRLGINKIEDRFLLSFIKKYDSTISSDLDLILEFLQRLKPYKITSNLLSILKDPQLRGIRYIDIHRRKGSKVYYYSDNPFDKKNQGLELTLNLKEEEQIIYVKTRWKQLVFENIPQEIDTKILIKRLTNIIKPNTDINLMLKYIALIRRKCYVKTECLKFNTILAIANLIQLNYNINMLILIDDYVSLNKFKPEFERSLLDCVIWNHRKLIPSTKKGFMYIKEYTIFTKIFTDEIPDVVKDVLPDDTITRHIPVYELPDGTYEMAFKSYLSDYNPKQPANQQIPYNFINCMLELRKYKLIKNGKSHLINKENYNDMHDYNYDSEIRVGFYDFNLSDIKNRRLEVTQDKEILRLQELSEFQYIVELNQRLALHINKAKDSCKFGYVDTINANQLKAINDLKNLMYTNSKYTTLKNILNSPIFQDNKNVLSDIQNILKELHEGDRQTFNWGEFPGTYDPRISTLLDKIKRLRPDDQNTRDQLYALSKATKNPTVIQLCTSYMFNSNIILKAEEKLDPTQYFLLYRQVQLEIMQEIYKT